VDRRTIDTDLYFGIDNPGIILLTPDEYGSIKTSAAVIGRLVHVIDVCKQGRSVSMIPQDLSEQAVILEEGLPSRFMEMVSTGPP
jgi:hypothetical protein